MNGFLTILSVLGGVGLFLFGMEMVTRGLTEALGPKLHHLLQKVTARPVLGLLGGAATATLIFSGPTTVMVVNFVNAGLVNLAQAIPVILGANVGTTIALQVVAFDLTPYALGAIAVAMAVRLFARQELSRTIASAVLGFGLLFLGLSLMQSALEPFRESEQLHSAIALVSTRTFGGMLLGIVLSAMTTSVMMSSGAMIALAFALARVGLIESFEQAFPILLGAHIGTTVIALLGAIGASTNAKRAALAHLLFNIGGTIVALLLMRVYLAVIPQTSDNLVRQIANGHTLIQLVNALVFLPFAGGFAAIIKRIGPGKNGEEGEEERSHLDPDMVKTPELALMMIIKEMRRQARICERMLHRSMESLLSLDLNRFAEVKQDENSVDAIKRTLDRYFVLVGERQLTRRQSMLLQHLVSGSNDLERIADHIETIGLLTRTKVNRKIWFDDESMMRLVELGRLVSRILSRTVDSLEPVNSESRELAQEVLQLRKEYKQRARAIREEFNSRLFEGAEDAITGMFYMRYITVFDRIIRHVRGIARVELKEEFEIHPYRLHVEAPLRKPAPPTAEEEEHLDEDSLFAESRRDPD